MIEVKGPSTEGSFLQGFEAKPRRESLGKEAEHEQKTKNRSYAYWANFT